MDFVLLSYRTKCPFILASLNKGLGWGMRSGRGLNPSLENIRSYLIEADWEYTVCVCVRMCGGGNGNKAI